MEQSMAIPLTGLITMQGVTLFSSHAPPIRQLRKAHKMKDADILAELRVAEVEAASVMILAGTAISAMTGSPAPAYLSIATVIIMIGVYEWTLAQPPLPPSLLGETIPVEPPSQATR